MGFLMILGSSFWVYGQAVNCTPGPGVCTASVSGTINFSAITWSGTGCPTSGSTFYSGNLCLDLANNTVLTINKNFTINGGFGISTNKATIIIPAGDTLNVTGSMGNNSNNNADYVINGVLNVGGTLYGKNGNGFTGSGTVNAGGLDFKGDPDPCIAPACAINWIVPPGACQPAASDFCVVVLPVTLLFFEAKTYPDYVKLEWATASELNFDRFVIEKTRDGNTFTEIGERQGAGVSTSRIDYSFKDDQIMLGRTYYRLKAIDFDGYTEYFGMVSVYYEGVNEISVFPNPAASGDVNIYFNYFSDAPVFYKVMDVSGAETISGTIQRSGFDNQYTIKKSLATGMYYLVVSQIDHEKKVIRFVVH